MLVTRRRSNMRSYGDGPTVAPTVEPISLADVKTFLRIDGTADDAILTSLIASARRMAEEFTKRAFITQTWKLSMDSFSDTEVQLTGGFAFGPPPHVIEGSQRIQLARRPVQSITAIETYNTTNTKTTISAATYALDTAGGFIMLNEGYSWPTSLRDYAAVEITFKAGYGDAASAVPDTIKTAIMTHVAAMYGNKACADMPDGCKTLLQPFQLPEAFGAW